MLPPGFRELSFTPRDRRSRLERAALRYPAVRRVGAVLMARLPPGPLRRAFLERVILPLSYGSLNRGDLHALASIYFTEDVRIRFSGSRIPGFPSEIVGAEKLTAAYSGWLEDWADLERAPVGYAEAPNTLVVLVRQRAHGDASGLRIEDEIGQVYRLRGGLAAEYVEYRSWDEAIRQAGLEH